MLGNRYMATISIVVPVYNVESKLYRCLVSIQNQTYSDFEVLLIDDGSKDSSGLICDEFVKMDSRFKVYHIENRGVSGARNFGIEKSLGEYLTFVDSDDYVETEYLSKLLVEDGAELVISNVNYCSADLKQKLSQVENGNYCIILKEQPDQIADLLKMRKLNYVYAKLYRNDIISDYNIRFHEEVSLGEDTMFVFDYLLHTSKISVIASSNYNYIKYGTGTLSSNFYWDIYSRHCKVNDYLEASITAMHLESTMIQAVLEVRRIEAMKWSISLIRKSKIKTYKKVKLIKNILHDEKLYTAIQNSSPVIRDKYYQFFAKNKNTILLLLYLRLSESIDVFFLKFKAVVVKIIPKKVVQRIKKWK